MQLIADNERERIDTRGRTKRVAEYFARCARAKIYCVLITLRSPAPIVPANALCSAPLFIAINRRKIRAESITSRYKRAARPLGEPRTRVNNATKLISRFGSKPAAFAALRRKRTTKVFQRARVFVSNERHGRSFAADRSIEREFRRECLV